MRFLKGWNNLKKAGLNNLTWGFTHCLYKKKKRGKFITLLAALLCVFVTGCARLATPPEVKEGGAGYVNADDFNMWLAYKNGTLMDHGGMSERLDMQAPLIVVLEGDGLPWSRPWRISSDPTSPDPLMFDWYRQWPGEALYLGRPCYFGAKSRRVPPAPWDVEEPPETQSCFAYWYTHGRYSEEVVTAMAQVLRMKAGDRPLLLLGHSGGGALAMLLAARMSNTVAVMTLSGNLNVAAWTSGHDFSPLTGSLDPAASPPLNRDVRQSHWAARGDETVKPEWIEKEAARQQATFQLGPASKHSDWRHYWPQINDAISQLKATISRQR
ncbi:conserved hypothetical protein [Hahella chejuensis KCTC 2396]|uniref:AB hydrolase-1 domain-containing protein n=1 Tax=Hahella chejuensis (strain KCTC 2396) TaxID=349521 RepID=Q2SEH2_HAHCH|nr:conserved hypothetical protein [Hahella chejuensis KCTC 2396]